MGEPLEKRGTRTTVHAVRIDDKKDKYLTRRYCSYIGRLL